MPSFPPETHTRALEKVMLEAIGASGAADEDLGFVALDALARAAAVVIADASDCDRALDAFRGCLEAALMAERASPTRLRRRSGGIRN